MESDLWIWVNKWDEFQSFQKKRGKPWAPPWIKIYPQLLDDYVFVKLPWQTQLVLLKVFMAFAQTRGSLSADTRELSRQLAQRVTAAQLESLNHAGYIDICSGTVLEQRRNVFWNSSNLEENRREEDIEEKALGVSDTRNGAQPASEQHGPGFHEGTEEHPDPDRARELVAKVAASFDDIPF